MHPVIQCVESTNQNTLLRVENFGKWKSWLCCYSMLLSVISLAFKPKQTLSVEVADQKTPASHFWKNQTGCFGRLQHILPFMYNDFLGKEMFVTTLNSQLAPLSYNIAVIELQSTSWKPLKWNKQPFHVVHVYCFSPEWDFLTTKLVKDDIIVIQ